VVSDKRRLLDIYSSLDRRCDIACRQQRAMSKRYQHGRSPFNAAKTDISPLETPAQQLPIGSDVTCNGAAVG